MTTADKIAAAMAKWRKPPGELPLNWDAQTSRWCAKEVEPILAELQREQGLLTPLVKASRDLLEVIYQLDAREELPSEINGELIDRVRQALLSAPTSVEPLADWARREIRDGVAPGTYAPDDYAPGQERNK